MAGSYSGALARLLGPESLVIKDVFAIFVTQVQLAGTYPRRMGMALLMALPGAAARIRRRTVVIVKSLTHSSVVSYLARVCLSINNPETGHSTIIRLLDYVICSVNDCDVVYSTCQGLCGRDCGLIVQGQMVPVRIALHRFRDL